MAIHKLKTHPTEFAASVSGEKRCEFRENDRDYKVGDQLILEEFDPNKAELTGNAFSVRVKHIQHGGKFGIPEDYVMMTVFSPDWTKRAPRRFNLNRIEDETGVSGTGRVASGVRWPDGSATLRWMSDRPTTTVYNSMEDVGYIHSHHGSTVVEWIDEE